MKKIIALMLSLVMVLGVCGCGAQKGEETSPAGETTVSGVDELELNAYENGVFTAGYSRKNMTPDAPVPLAGYGNTNRRISKEVGDDIYVTSIAMTDEDGDSILLMTMDSCRAYPELVDPSRTKISQATGIPEERIVIACSHTHSSPDYSNKVHPNMVAATEKALNCIYAAAIESLNDRKPATMLSGDIEAEGLNFVRHYYYLDKDGNKVYFGDNFGTAPKTGEIYHVSEADPTMHVLQLQREGAKDIILTNWRAHPHFTGGSSTYVMSSDYVGPFREAFEAQYDGHFVYFQGAAGNINENTRKLGETKTRDYKVYGKLLADYAIECLEGNMKAASGTDIDSRQMIMEGKVNHAQDDMYIKAKEIATIWSSTADRQLCLEMGEPYGIRSPYHANAINNRYNKGETETIELDAIVVGDDIAIVTAPHELSDTNSVWLEENSPYAMTFTFGYANGHNGYIPSALTWEHTSYETDISVFEPGTAEELQNNFLSMLKEMAG